MGRVSLAKRDKPTWETPKQFDYQHKTNPLKTTLTEMNPRRHLRTRKTSNQGTKAMMTPTMICNISDVISVFFRPNLKVRNTGRMKKKRQRLDRVPVFLIRSPVGNDTGNESSDGDSRQKNHFGGVLQRRLVAD